MSNDNKEFFNLLASISNEKTFALELMPREQDNTLVQCKYLTTAHLKDLIKSVVDSPITQSVFNSSTTRVFKQCLTGAPSYALNVIDRLLFIIEARITALSPVLKTTINKKDITIDFLSVKQKLLESLKQNAALLRSSSATEGNISLTYGVPLLDVEHQLNEELYKDLNPDIENPEELRKILGDAFVNEIAKSLQTITIEDKTMDLSKVSFRQRLQIIEKLPASLIQKVIEYIEVYKKILEPSLSVDGETIPIDGTLFSVR